MSLLLFSVSGRQDPPLAVIVAFERAPVRNVTHKAVKKVDFGAVASCSQLLGKYMRERKKERERKRERERLRDSSIGGKPFSEGVREQ